MGVIPQQAVNHSAWGPKAWPACALAGHTEGGAISTPGPSASYPESGRMGVGCVKFFQGNVMNLQAELQC